MLALDRDLARFLARRQRPQIGTAHEGSDPGTRARSRRRRRCRATRSSVAERVSPRPALRSTCFGQHASMFIAFHEFMLIAEALQQCEPGRDTHASFLGHGNAGFFPDCGGKPGFRHGGRLPRLARRGAWLTARDMCSQCTPVQRWAAAFRSRVREVVSARIESGVPPW